MRFSLIRRISFSSGDYFEELLTGIFTCRLLPAMKGYFAKIALTTFATAGSDVA